MFELHLISFLNSILKRKFLLITLCFVMMTSFLLVLISDAWLKDQRIQENISNHLMTRFFSEDPDDSYYKFDHRSEVSPKVIDIIKNHYPDVEILPWAEDEVNIVLDSNSFKSQISVTTPWFFKKYHYDVIKGSLDDLNENSIVIGQKLDSSIFNSNSLNKVIRIKNKDYKIRAVISDDSPYIFNHKIICFDTNNLMPAKTHIFLWIKPGDSIYKINELVKQELIKAGIQFKRLYLIRLKQINYFTGSDQEFDPSSR